MEWSEGIAIHRVHSAKYGAAEFNPGTKGDARFSPITNSATGKAIPTLYGGNTFTCAIMETAFHDVPFVAGPKTFNKLRLTEQVHSKLVPVTALVLADLRNLALRKLGVTRGLLIDSDPTDYPITRKWAEAIYSQAPTLQGLCWTSRQDDSSTAVMLFGDRIDPGALKVANLPLSLLKDIDTYRKLQAIADRIGVFLVG